MTSALSGLESPSAIKLYPATGRSATGIPPTGNRQPQESTMRDPVDCDRGVIDIIVSFVGIHTFISVASVSTRWRHAWGQRPKVTSPKWAIQSCLCLEWAEVCGLDISNKPCLLAASEGRLDVLQHAVALGYSREGMAICERAAAGGHLEVVKWGRANGFPWGRSKLLAAEHGHLEVLQWCVASNAPDVARRTRRVYPIRGSNWLVHETSQTEVLNAAVEGGQLETVKWCIQRGYRWDDETCYLAAKGGNLDLLKWLREKGCPWSEDTILGAVDAGDVEMLEWCRVNGCKWEESVYAAICQGNVEIVKWCAANAHHGQTSHWACRCAAIHGNMEVLQWLRGMGFEWGHDVCFWVASGGHFEALKWCVANGCLWDTVPGTKNGWAFHGTIPMMVWATENGCPWMADRESVNSLCWHAAEGGNLEVLKWCATNHRMESSGVLMKVVLNGYTHVLEWLRVNTGVLDGWTDSLCTTAAWSGSLETMKWCRANGYAWCEMTCTAAVEGGNLELLQWCRADGCPWGDDTCEVVIQRGDFEMLAWCRENGCPPGVRWKESSLVGGQAEMIEWCW